jgi:hypothetical protein
MDTEARSAIEYGATSGIPTNPMDADRPKNWADGSWGCPVEGTVRWLPN